MRRRTFIKNTLLSSSSFVLLPSALDAIAIDKLNGNKDKIKNLAESLLEKWCRGLYDHQTNNPEDPLTDGGIFSPGDKVYLGRCADALYPFLWMAQHTKDEKYLTAAKKVYTC